MSNFSSYEHARAEHSWNGPERFNIASDVEDRCDPAVDVGALRPTTGSAIA
jgi:hypothetical protein